MMQKEDQDGDHDAASADDIERYVEDDDDVEIRR